jgi:tRNA threonylcarbamoyladenosine biosynthesis protein TsaE
MIRVILENREVLLASFKNVSHSDPRKHESSNPQIIKKFITNSPDETKEIGLRLGRFLKPGDVVGLCGELGSGKTTFIKGIARALGIENKDIASASFTIIAEYNTKPPFFHIDLYRIEKDTELDALGFWDQIGGDGISVIEWAEKAGKRLPEETIKVYLKSLGDDKREIIIEGRNEQNWDNL